eukprot:Skav234114  [mRNA]  locus=scaffold4487:81149:86691:- [translate_table: standard]
MGSDVAEQEALLWAFLWRLAHNINVPTAFVADNQFGLALASGHQGTQEPSILSASVRGLFQALEAALGIDGIMLHHVSSHMGDPMNEFVDTAASLERQTSQHLPRQAINLPTWTPGIPFLWMLFDSTKSIPQWVDGALMIEEPSMPSCSLPDDFVDEGLHQEVQQTLQDYTFNIPELPASLPVIPADIHACMLCRKRFRSRAGQGAHFFKVHNVVAECRLRFDTTACSICLREFHSAAKMKTHLQYSQKCLSALRGQKFLCEPLPGIGSQADADRARQVDSQHLPQQGFGPHRQDAPRHLELDPFSPPLLDELMERLLDCTNIIDVEAAFVTSIQAFAVSWETTCATLTHVLTVYNDNEADTTGIAVEDIQQLIDRLRQPDQWPFLTDPLEQPIPRDLCIMEDLYADICSRDRGLRRHYPDVPRPFGKLRFILHAYSGRRRYGDIQFFLDKEHLDEAPFTIQVLSVDIIIDEHYGDLMNEKTQAFWVSMIRDRIVVGLIAGPPCNTFSKVRKKQLENNARGPRAVRSPTHPWALPSLTLRELSQVFAGNLLLAFAVMALYELVGTGGCGLLEHPADPETEEDVTIWKIPIIAALFRFETVDFLTVAQGPHGSEGAKATGLLALRLPTLRQQLRAWRLADWHVQGQTAGRASDGTFHSAKLKEYPPSFCSAIAASFRQSLGQFPIDQSIEPPANFLALCQRLVTSTRGSNIGLDYHCKDR